LGKLLKYFHSFQEEKMTVLQQNVTELLDAMVKAYPTGLPQGVHININLNLNVSSANNQYQVVENAQDSVSLNIEGDAAPGESEGGPLPSYKGDFLGLFRVVPRTESGRIKIRSHPEPKAPEAVVKLTDAQYRFIKALNTARFHYLETNGYVYVSDNGSHNVFYKQYGFDKQLLVVSEIRKVGDSRMGRVVGIGVDPYLADPKPLDVSITNHKNTPWLVHSITSVEVFAPILTGDSVPGWIDMIDVEKVR
jgi:hypothetical protein